MSDTKTLLGLLLLPVSYDTTQPLIAAELDAEGAFLMLYSDCQTVFWEAVTPVDAQSLLTDWERILDINGRQQLSAAPGKCVIQIG